MKHNWENVFDSDGRPVESWDDELGHVKWTTRTEHHDAVEGVEEVGHWHTIAEYPETGGKDVEWVVDVPGVEAREAYDEEIGYYLYEPYTEAEKAALPKNLAARADETEAALCEVAEMAADSAEAVGEHDTALVELADMAAQSVQTQSDTDAALTELAAMVAALTGKQGVTP